MTQNRNHGIERYVIDNMTFCSEADKYPDNPEATDFWFNHLEADGLIEVHEDDSMEASIRLSPRLRGLEIGATIDSLFRIYLNANHRFSNIWNISLKKDKNSYETYGHDQPERLTFVVKEPNPNTGNTVLYKIHSKREQE